MKHTKLQNPLSQFKRFVARKTHAGIDMLQEAFDFATSRTQWEYGGRLADIYGEMAAEIYKGLYDDKALFEKLGAPNVHETCKHLQAMEQEGFETRGKTLEQIYAQVKKRIDNHVPVMELHKD